MRTSNLCVRSELFEKSENIITFVHSLVPTWFQPRFIRSYAWLTSLADIMSVLLHFVLIYKIQEISVPRGLPFHFDHHLSSLDRMVNGCYIK